MIHFKRRLNRRGKILVGGIIALFLLGGFGIHHHHENQEALKPKISIVHHSDTHVSANQNLDYNNQMSNYSVNYIIPFATPMKASSALVMDATNGHILYGKHMRQQRRVASLAKLMTLYLVQKKANHLHAWNQRVITPQNLVHMSNDIKDGLGGFKFKKGHHYTVRQLYEAAVIDSSNNSAIALGEWVAGSNTAFVHLMNKQAKIWHLNCHFVSASGLENDDLSKFHLNVLGNKNDANHLSALNLAIITRHLLHAYPQITDLTKQSQATVDGQKMYNVNGLLKGKPWYTPKLNIVGLKSGFTPSAGYNFIAYAKPKGKHPLIAITLNDPREFPDLRDVLQNVYKKDKLLNYNDIN